MRCALPVVCALAIQLASLPCAAEQRADVRGFAYATGWAHDENSGDGFSYFAARTFVDCAHTRVGYRQSADILTGAYSHARDGRVLSYADLGVLLQNDGLAPGHLGRPNKVQLYGQASTRAHARLLRFPNGPHAAQRAFNVACDTVLAFAFFVASSGDLVVRYTGTFVPKHGSRRFAGSVVLRITGFVGADGWSARCERCAVRRVNTMAVNGGPPTRPGAYFAVVTGADVRRPAGWWKSSVEGRYTAGPPGDPHSYVLRPFSARRADIVDMPPDGERRPAGRPAFLLRGAGTPNMAIGLDEREALGFAESGRRADMVPGYPRVQPP